MRKALTWLAGLAGIAALLRRRSRAAAIAPVSVEAPPDPAEELRRRLDETRDVPAAAADSDPSGSLDERRARVHERAQDAITLMRGADPEEPDPGAGPERDA